YASPATGRHTYRRADSCATADDGPVRGRSSSGRHSRHASVALPRSGPGAIPSLALPRTAIPAAVMEPPARTDEDADAWSIGVPVVVVIVIRLVIGVAGRRSD